jgi:hypothetical protein
VLIHEPGQLWPPAVKKSAVWVQPQNVAPAVDVLVDDVLVLEVLVLDVLVLVEVDVELVLVDVELDVLVEVEVEVELVDVDVDVLVLVLVDVVACVSSGKQSSQRSSTSVGDGGTNATPWHRGATPARR